MITEMIDGFCMALADSVPGVSGGTVAFLMGFYDPFIGSVRGAIFGRGGERKKSLSYLLRLGIGWCIGMALAVIALNALFEDHIYVVSSLFMGLLVGAFPAVCGDEKESVRQWKKGLPFFAAGLVLVALVTYASMGTERSSMDLLNFTPLLGIQLFLIGIVAVAAMFLPGISGSTMLLVFGAYLPVMTALNGLLSLNFAYLPGLLCYVLGVVFGAASVVKLIQTALKKYRPQMIWFILGMMAASLYAIAMGPTTLDVPQAPLSLSTFSIVAFLVGVLLVVLMQAAKKAQEGNAERIHA